MILIFVPFLFTILNVPGSTCLVPSTQNTFLRGYYLVYIYGRSEVEGTLVIFQCCVAQDDISEVYESHHFTCQCSFFPY